MRSVPLFAFSLVLPLCVAFTAYAEPDAAGCKDHPAIPRFPGYYLASCSQNDFDSVKFRIDQDGKEVTKEGKRWTLTYGQIGDKIHSNVEVFRNYANAFKKAGGKVVWVEENGSGQSTLMMPLGKSERWLLLGANPGRIDMDIIEVAQMEQQLELGASEMLDALNKDGFVALHGILFDTGKDTIQPASEPLLAEIVKLLKDNPGLKLSVEGHTDNVGQAKANQELSQKRAERVKKSLAGKGIDGKRLEAKGWGDTKPVGDNRKEDGRAQNRRVELVKK